MTLLSPQTKQVLLGDRYKVLAPIGVGTAANVFRVRDRRTGAMRAAKVLKPENAAKPSILARFEDEFRILRTLHHPHLPEVYDYGWTDDGGRFLVMELVDGVPLDQFFRANPGDIWAILYELCETLTFVHNHKLLHQDIKPSNILVKRTTAFGPDLPLVKLIDFGLTYRRDAGVAVELVGTPEYMAPEVVRGESTLTRAVDYYSLGATLYELLCGRPPFVGSANEVLRAHLQREAVIDEEHLEWAELYPHVRALLAKDHRARLQAFEELRRAVVSRLTGGIEELDRAYGLARIDSLPMIGKEGAEEWLDELDRALPADANRARALDIRGRSGTLRNHLLDFVCAEGTIRGFKVVRLGDKVNGDALRMDAGTPRKVDRFNKVIERFQDPHSTAALLVLNGIEHLGDDESSFIRYLSTKRALTTGTETPVFFVIARGRGIDSHSLDSYLPPDRQSIQLPADSAGSETDEGAGDLRAQLAASGVLEGKGSDARRRLLAYVASHPAFVPVEWAKEFVGGSAAAFVDAIDQFATRHLISKVVVDGGDALLASDDARAVVQSVVPRAIVVECHRDLVARLKGVVDSSARRRSSVQELVAQHHTSLGGDREALVAYIRAVKAAWQERSLSSVERLSYLSLDALATSTTNYAKAARRHFAKQWVAALWARNQHTRAKQVIDDHLLKHGDPIPPSLLPKYIRGILDAKEPASAMEFLDTIDVGGYSPGVREQLLLERALVLWHGAQIESSLAILEELRDSVALPVRDRHRVTIYRSMNLSSLAAYDQVEDLLREAAARARADGCYDEFVLMSAIRAQTQIILGRPRDALRAIAQTLPVAHRNELYLRINLLYRLSAGAYQDMGLAPKAIVSQKKAIALASALGLRQFEAMSWSRLSEYERVLGSFGNAIRYHRKASAVMAMSSYEADRARIQLAEMQLHSWLRSPDLPRVIKNAAWIKSIGNVNERGRYFMMLGIYWADEGDWGQAWRCYDKATELLQRTGFVDNLIILNRARLRLAMSAGLSEPCFRESRATSSRTLKSADSKNAQLERSLALLEYAFNSRAKWSNISAACESCLQLCDESTEATSRLEALSLVFRIYARNKKYVEAMTVFGKFYLLLKAATSNLDDDYVAGLLDRVALAQLTREYDLMEKRNKAGVAANLVA